jgi:tRNA(Arg) A34 adenosine deaminase TadA
MEDENRYFMDEAIQLSMLQDKGGPFGAVIVRDGIVIGSGRNEVLTTNDPTAHAEMVAIRDACKTLNTFKLSNCILYTSCEPCPMCLSAAYWADIKTIFYGCTRYDAAAIGFDDEFIYDELNQSLDKREITMFSFSRTKALKAFESWSQNPNRTMY